MKCSGDKDPLPQSLLSWQAAPGQLPLSRSPSLHPRPVLLPLRLLLLQMPLPMSAVQQQQSC